jgi:hypothetical protein
MPISQACLQEADTLKQEGNDLFRASKWEAALSTYRSALGRLPKRIEPLAPVPPRRDDAIDDDTPEEFSTAPPSPVDEEGSTSPPPHAAELSKARATLNANIAACFVKLVRERRCAVRGALLTARAGRAITRKLSAHAAKVSLLRSLPPCITAQVYLALKDDPSYTKALTRRAAANEALNTWSSLSAAQEGMYIGALHPTMPLDSDLNCPLDYEKLLTLVPAAETGKIRATLNKVKPRAEAAQRQEMGEMVDKLKGLGNSLLGASARRAWTCARS